MGLPGPEAGSIATVPAFLTGITIPGVKSGSPLRRGGPGLDCAGNTRNPGPVPDGSSSCCCLLRLCILGYVTGERPGELGVRGDSVTGDRSTCGTSSMMSSSSKGGAAIDSIDVVEPVELRLPNFLADLRLDLVPVNSLPPLIISKYVSGGGRFLGRGLSGPGVTEFGALYGE